MTLTAATYEASGLGNNSGKAGEAERWKLAEAHEIKFGKMAGPLRAALAGRSVTPSVFDMMLVLGRDETILRLTQAEGYAG